MRTIVTLALALSAASVTLARQDPGDESLRRAARAIYAAEIRNDAAFLDRAWAPDYTETNQFGVVHNKSERLAEVRSGANAFESIRQGAVRVQLFGEAAVVTERLEVKGTVAGRPVGGAVRALTVFVKREGRWQAVAAQYTGVREP